YRRPGLARSLIEHAPARNMRANAADLAALLDAGSLDYIYDYQSVAESHGFRFVRLPPEIDLGDAARAPDYAQARVTVRGTASESLRVAGQPILYAVSIPLGAPHPAVGARFLRDVMSTETRARLREAHVDMLDTLAPVGVGAPEAIRGDRKSVV